MIDGKTRALRSPSRTRFEAHLRLELDHGTRPPVGMLPALYYYYCLVHTTKQAQFFRVFRGAPSSVRGCFDLLGRSMVIECTFSIITATVEAICPLRCQKIFSTMLRSEGVRNLSTNYSVNEVAF